jgi:hypothetical protein
LTFYQFLSDPAWSSVGALVTAGGVFIGAWYGTKLANETKEKSDAEDLKKTLSAYERILNDEVYRNKRIAEKMKSYLTLNPPIHAAFDSLLAGSSHLKFGTWDKLVGSKVSNLLTVEQQLSYQIYYQHVRNLSANIAMEVAEWKRICDFHQYYKENPPQELMQLGNPRDILVEKTGKLESEIKEALRIINIVCANIENSWVKENR